MDALDSLDDFLNWQFGITLLAIQSMVWLFRTGMAVLSPATGERPWWKFTLTVLNVAFGVLAALVPNLLKGDTLAIRIVVGIGAGLVSHYAYHLLLKRWLNRLSPPGSGDVGAGASPKGDEKAGGP
jgi:hypothetical protein